MSPTPDPSLPPPTSAATGVARSADARRLGGPLGSGAQGRAARASARQDGTGVSGYDGGQAPHPGGDQQRPPGPPPVYGQPGPYAQQPAPYGQQAAPYGQQPAPYGQQPPAQPWGGSAQPQAPRPYAQPYGRQPSGQPYRQPFAQQPYGQVPYGGAYGQPYGAPYGQPYGAHYGQPSAVVPPLYDRPRRRGNGPVIVATVVVWALVMVGIVVGVDALQGTPGPDPVPDDASALVRVADPDELPPPMSSGTVVPTPGFGEEPSRLRRAEPPAVPSDEYAFLETYGSGEPVGWSPCRPIHVVVNLDGAPPGFLAELFAVLGDITELTGLVFVYDGETTEEPDLSRESFQPERYGDRWAPVLVAWTDDDKVSDMEEDVVGLAMSESRGDLTTGVVSRVSGEVYLDTELRRYPDDPTGQEAWVSVLHHELGHLIGLDHVDATDQLMYPEDSGRLRSFQEGDRTGLYELGQGACAPGV